MKKQKLAGIGLLLLLVGCSAPATTQNSQQTGTNQPAMQKNNFEGAWRMRDMQDTTVMMLVQDGFFTVAMYDLKNKKFIGTTGGTYATSGDQLTINYEFYTFDPGKVGTSVTTTFDLQPDSWRLTSEGDQPVTETWDRVPETEASPLNGTWRITGRARDGQMTTMQPGPRKTLKVLSGSRFQWIAFNSETGEFSGTGGGTFTARDGKYTENIEFFSRDSSRVGASLSFNFEVKDGNWHHTGQSSTGSPINEIWTRISAGK